VVIAGNLADGRPVDASASSFTNMTRPAERVVAFYNKRQVADRPAGETVKIRAKWCAMAASHIPDGRGRGAEEFVAGDFAADRGTTATVTTKRPMDTRSKATDGGVHPNASKNRLISPLDNSLGCSRLL
jgi:hypothetical protein